MVMGSPTGSYAAARNIAVGPIPVQVEKGDFDRDGHLDLAILSTGTKAGAAAEYGQTLHVLRGNGLGGFSSPYVIALRTLDLQPRFAVGDLTGDGWLDLALLEWSPGRIRVARNLASAAGPAFEEVPAPIATGTDPQSIAAGDLDGDGKCDLAVALRTHDGGAIEALLSDGTGGARRGEPKPIAFVPTCMAAGPIDEGGTVDLAIGGAAGDGSGRAGVLTGDGTGAFGDPAESVLRAPPSEVALGDLDRNGTLDLVLPVAGQNLLVSILVDAPEAPPRFVRGDANGDGSDDISDAVASLRYLFIAVPVRCLEALDTNDDLKADIADPIYLLNHLFAAGPAPPPPYPEPGEETEGHTLGCGT